MEDLAVEAQDLQDLFAVPTGTLDAGQDDLRAIAG